MLTAGLSCTIQVFDFPRGGGNGNLRPGKSRPSAEPYAMPRELPPPLTETHSRSVKHVPLVAAAQLCGIMKGISRRAEHMLWVGAVPKQRAVQAASRAHAAVCSVNRQSNLVEPRCSVPVTALRTNLAVHDLEESTSTQCESAAGRGLTGEFAKKRATAAPLNDGPVTILENALDPSVAVWERPEELGEIFEHSPSSPEWLAERHLDVRRVLVIERSGCRSVTLIEGGCPLCHNLFGRLHEEEIWIVVRNGFIPYSAARMNSTRLSR